MSKKLKIILILLTVIIISIVCAFTLYANAQTDKQTAFLKKAFIAQDLAAAEQLDENLPTVVEFYSPDCSFCVHFNKTFQKLAKEYKGKYNFAQLNINDPSSLPLARGNVGGIPALYIFDAKIGNKIHIASMNLQDIRFIEPELNRYLRIRSFIDIDKCSGKFETLLEELKNEQKN